MQEIQKIRKTDDFIICILLILACLNFLKMGSVFLVFFNLYVLFKLSFRFKIDREAWFYLILMLAMIVSGLIFYSTNEIIKAFNYGFCYLSGYNLCVYYQKNVKNIEKMIFYIFLGYFIYIVLLLYGNYDLKTNARVLVDIWSGKYISVTLVAVISSVSVAYASYLLLFEKIYLKLVGGVILTIAFILNFITATRTLFVLLPLALVFSFWVKYLSEKKKMGVLLYGLVLLTLLVIVVVFDVFSVRTLVVESTLGERFVETDSMSRIDIALYHLKYSWKYPFGGGYVGDEVGKLAHNIIQDFYDVYGMFASVACTFIIVLQIKKMSIFIRRNNSIKQEKLMAIIMFTMLVQIWTEPIISGYPIYVWTLFFIQGIASAYLGYEQTYEVKK